MLYIIYTKESGTSTQTFDFKDEGTLMLRGNERDVVEVQADGEEMEHIFRNFDHVPFNVKKRGQVWYGDMAKFIAANF